MNKEIEITIVVLVILTVIAVLFIRRAIRHRRLVEDADESQLAKGSITANGHDGPLTVKDSYLLRYIYLTRPQFKGNFTQIRPQYHEWIKKIIHVVGKDGTSITAYIDRVLKAHFDENREVINDLYNDRLDDLFNEDQGDE